MTANGKRHGNGSGRGNKAGQADQRSAKRVSHNGSHHYPMSDASTANQRDENMAVLDEIDCLSAFHAVYHELQLIRTVRRPRELLTETQPVHHPHESSLKMSKNNKKSYHHSSADQQTLLFLGNIHPQLEQRASYRPTSYQPALIRYEHNEVISL